MEPILNKKAKFNYTLEETFQAGIVLEGWEIKPILGRKMNLDNSHVIIEQGELYLFNALVTPLISTSTHTAFVSDRRRKLLMKKQEIMRLIGKVEKAGYTLVPTKVYRKNKHIKVEIALAKGKKLHDKRDSEKDADWKREQEQLMKKSTKL